MIGGAVLGIPRTVHLEIDGVVLPDFPADRVDWVIGWLVNNPSQVTDLANTLRQLDKVKSFYPSVSYACRRRNATPLTCAKRVLKNALLCKRIDEILKYLKEHHKKKLVLANGLPCTIASNKWTYTYVYLKCGETRVRLEMGLNQLVTLEDKATRDRNTLKRMRPQFASYLKNRRWQYIPYPLYPLLMKAIAKKLPLEVALLITDPRGK
jgi:hypothetical protein